MNILEDYLPFFKELNQSEKDAITSSYTTKKYEKGKILRGIREDCLGLVLVLKGRLRVYLTSDEGKEVTLYRLLERDMCLFSASCIMKNIQFEVMVQAEEDSEIIIISPSVYKRLMDTSLPVSKYTNELMSSRITDVIWLVDLILNKRLDERLASLLLEESEYAQSDKLRITHEQLGNHLGSAREVITRMLRQFQNDGLVSLQRGSIEILDKDALYDLSESIKK